MISKQQHTKQFRRLMRLPCAPVEQVDLEIAEGEFTRITEAHCHSDAHLAAVVDSICDTAQYFPVSAVIVETAKTVPPPELATAPTGCDECGGTGWHQVERGQYSAVEFCRCRLGQWRKSKKSS